MPSFHGVRSAAAHHCEHTTGPTGTMRFYGGSAFTTGPQI